MRLGGHILAEVVLRWIIIKSMFNEFLGYTIHALIHLVSPQVFPQIINTIMSSKVLFLIATCWKIFIWPAMDGTPITHDKAIETEYVSELSSQEVKIGTGIDAVDLVLATHGSTNASLNGSLKRRVVHFKLCPFINYGVLLIAVRFTLIVCEMLHCCDYIVALYAVDHRSHQLGGKVRILPCHVLVVPAVETQSHQVESRSQDDTSSLLPEFLTQSITILLRKIQVPGLAQCQYRRPNSGRAVIQIVSETLRSRLIVYGRVLQTIVAVHTAVPIIKTGHDWRVSA